jgi:hypothetical protein
MERLNKLLCTRGTICFEEDLEKPRSTATQMRAIQLLRE